MGKVGWGEEGAAVPQEAGTTGGSIFEILFSFLLITSYFHTPIKFCLPIVR